MDGFIPTHSDILRTRAYFRHRLGLPNELVFAILDETRYWVERTQESSRHEVLLDTEWSNNSSSYAYPYLGITALQPRLSSPLVDEIPKIKEIEFLIVSHDQG